MTGPVNHVKNEQVRFRMAAGRKFAIEFASYVVVRLLVAVIQTLPYDMGDAFCRTAARLLSGPLAVRAKTTDKNLSNVFPDADPASRQRLAEQMWHHLLLMVCEIAWAQRRLHLCNWNKHMTFVDNRRMLAHLLSRRPTIAVTGHFGNFEVGGYVNGMMGMCSTTIARRLDNRFLHDWVEKFRSARGQHMVDKDGCAPLIEKHLQAGGTLSLLADQHAAKGCWVNFLGIPASSHKALALFSLGSSAPMLVGYTRRVGGRPMQFESGYVAIADPAQNEASCQSVSSLTQWYNDQLATAVLQSPEQYWWLHRRWRTPPERVAKKIAKEKSQVESGTIHAARKQLVRTEA